MTSGAPIRTIQLEEGKPQIGVGEQQLVASPGDFIFLPRGTLHTFRNDGPDMLRLILTFVPAGIEQYFEEVFEPAKDRTAVPPPPTKELIDRLLATGPKHGIMV